MVTSLANKIRLVLRSSSSHQCQHRQKEMHQLGKECRLRYKKTSITGNGHVLRYKKTNITGNKASAQNEIVQITGTGWCPYQVQNHKVHIIGNGLMVRLPPLG